MCHFPVGAMGQVWYLIVSFFDICTLAFFSRFTDVSSLLFSIFLPNDVGSGNLWLRHLTDIHAFFISLFHPNVVGSGNM